MSLATALQGLFRGNTRTHEAAETKSDYGVIDRGKGWILVHAHSGEDALRYAGTDGMTAEGNSYVACNHQGGGMYYIEIEDWAGW
jgi:hypothetical protein